MAAQLTNNASSLIPAGVSSIATTLVVTTGDGAKFPILSAGDNFYLTLVDVNSNYEIVRVTARTDDTMTIVRGQIGTLAIPFPANSRAELRLTVENVIIAAGDYLLL
jgi:hypothetical protein